MRKPFTISITLFLWLASLLLVLVFVAVCSTALRSLSEISGKSSEVRDTSLPMIIETQRFFITIENLRRIAEVAYVSEDPKVRRIARLNAQSLAADPFFSRDSEFHTQGKELVHMIVELVDKRDATQENSLLLQELAREYAFTLNHMAAYVPNIQVMQDVMQAYFETSLSLAGTTAISRTNIARFERMKPEDIEKTRFIRKQCETFSVLYASLGPVCESQRELLDEYESTLDSLSENFASASRQWEMVDHALREIRDTASNDAEFVATEALSLIERTSAKAHRDSLIMFGGGVCFFLLYIFILHWFIVRPLRWTGRKLRELQSGILHGPVPAILIAEMYDVASLLDRFSSHLSELTSHASQLAEDAAEKYDLENLMGAVFQVSLDGYGVWAPGETYTANEGLLRLFGLKDIQELRQRREELGLTPSDQLADLYNQVIASGFLRKEMQLRNTAGETLPCEMSYLPVNWQGKACVLSYLRDLREQKRTEAILLAAKEEAEAAAKVKSEFLARMSHEIRTPMNGVLGLTHLALADSPPPAQQQYLEKIQASARILLRVINDILDFSKMESNRFTLEHTAFSFKGMLDTVVDLFRGQAEEKGLHFTLELDARIPAWLSGDELRLSQVLLNLCGNAVKFTEKGDVTLRIALQSETEEKALLRFSVIDSGVGMTAEQLAGLFQPFAQADTSTTRKYGGTGLGLVIAKLLVEMMQGSIEVASTPGQGSVFEFTVPLDKAAAPEEHAPEQAAPGTDDVLRGLHILLTEDNEINQEIAVALFESLGITATVAGNGAEALTVLDKQDVDGVFMDIQMPVMDGLTAVQKIREHARESVRRLPVIAMTAHAMQEDRDKSFAAGMTDHITKPIDVEELREKLLTWVAPARRKADPAAGQ